MKFTKSALVAALLFLGASASSAQGARDARHLILPILGYQAWSGEQTAVDYTYSFYAILFDSTFVVHSSHSGERAVNAPIFGVIYRYRWRSEYFAEASLGVIQNSGTAEYKVEIPIYNFTSTLNTSISRSITTQFNLDAGRSIPLRYKWLELAARGGVGLAWREIKVHIPFNPGGTTEFTSDIHDATQMFTARFGLDATLWKDNALVLTGSLYYQQFFPSGTDIDSFGGLGWRMSFFPIWRE